MAKKSGSGPLERGESNRERSVGPEGMQISIRDAEKVISRQPSGGQDTPPARCKQEERAERNRSKGSRQLTESRMGTRAAAASEDEAELL